MSIRRCSRQSALRAALPWAAAPAAAAAAFVTLLALALALAALLLGPARAANAGAPGAQTVASGARSVPEGTVVKVRLLDPLNSETTRIGDRVRVQVTDDDRSGLGRDTAFVGRVTEVQQASKTLPGVINIRFGVIERNGAWQSASGVLHSLNEQDVREDASGRLVGKRRDRRDAAKFIGYGAAGGAVVGYLLKNKVGSAVAGGLVGALAGYVYGELRKDDRAFQKVDLKEGAEFGILLDRPLRVNPSLAALR